MEYYVLTLACDDKPGIVAGVSTYLANYQYNITDSQQYRDDGSNRFFMRTEFAAKDDLAHIKAQFSPIADSFAMEWDIHTLDYKPRVLIAVSKAGHCLNHILYRYESGKLPIEIPAIISNHDMLRKMAEWHDIPFYHFPVTPDTKAQQEAQLIELVEKLDIDVVVLARYMQILSPDLCKKLHGKAINIHHSFLPGFKGADPYKQACERGVKIIGATAHYVTEELDEGPIIEQEVIRVDHSHTPEDLKLLGQDIESQVLSRALRYHIQRRVFPIGNKTVVFR